MRAHMCVAYEATFPLPGALMFALTPPPHVLIHTRADTRTGGKAPWAHAHTHIHMHRTQMACVSAKRLLQLPLMA